MGITEDYVSFDTAKLLKERGFVEECRAFYVKSKECGIELFPAERSHNYNDNVYPRTSAPTLQMAMKWLREVHNIDINIYAESLSHKKRYTISIWKNIQDDDAINDVILGVSTIYEEACETAIKYCLENLI